MNNMSELSERPHAPGHAPIQGPPEEQYDLAEVGRILRRQWRSIAFCGLMGVTLASLYIIGVVPFYRSSAEIMIDSRQLRAIRDVAALTDQVNNPDLGLVESQVEVLKSDNVLRGIMERLRLLDDRSFNASETTTPRKVLRSIQRFFDPSQWLPSNAAALTPEERAYRLERMTIDTLARNLTVSRTGRTWVIEVAYVSSNSNRAAAIVNAAVESYFAEQSRALFDAMQRASGWLQGRLAELSRQASDADMKAEAFRSENKLLAGINGNLVTDQQLAEVITQLSEARASAADADAKYQQINALIGSGVASAVVSDALNDPVVTELRKNMSELSRRTAELISQYGSDYFQVKKLNDEMREYERLVQEELGRIAASNQSSAEVARARVTSLEKQVADLEQRSSNANVARVQLRQLEQRADAYRNLYTSFLAKYQESLQQESFPLTEARVITPATKALQPSYPQKPILLLAGLALGCLAGAGIAGVRELFHRTIRTSGDVRNVLDLPFIGYLPLISTHSYFRRRSRQGPIVLRSLANPGQSDVFWKVKSIVDDRKDATASGCVVGVVSTQAGEGKSTISRMLSAKIAETGNRVIFIDADLRAQGRHRRNGRGERRGLLNALADNDVTFETLIAHTKEFDFINAGTRKAGFNAVDLLRSDRMAALIESCRKVYDYVILDLPPAGQFADAKAIEPVVDAFIFVIEWDKVHPGAALEVLDGEFGLRRKLVGAIFNKADLTKLRAYGARAGFRSGQNYYGASAV